MKMASISMRVVTGIAITAGSWRGIGGGTLRIATGMNGTSGEYWNFEIREAASDLETCIY